MRELSATHVRKVDIPGHPHKSRSDVLRAGVVKAQSAAGRGVGAQRRGLDEAEHSTMLKWVMAGPQVLHQELAEMSTVISRVKPVLIVLETGRQIGPVTQTQTNDQRAVKACNQTDAPNLIVRERWRASRLPSVPSALRGLDPRHPLRREQAVIGASVRVHRGDTRSLGLALRDRASGLWGVCKVRVSRDQRPGLRLHLLGRLHSDEASVEQQVVDNFQRAGNEKRHVDQCRSSKH